MLPDDFDFALMPEGPGTFSLKEVGMTSSTIEDIDYAITSWLKEDLELSTYTNEGLVKVPVLWQVPERAYQVKNAKELRDDGDGLKLPLISIERTNMTKDPAKKGSFQAHLYSVEKNGKPGRIVIARRIVQDKTRNFAVASGTRTNTGAVRQKYTKRQNKKVVIQSVSIPIPVYVDVEYKITLKTEYQQQMNNLIIPFITSTGQINSFVFEKNGYLYEAFIQQDYSIDSNSSNLGEDERMFQTKVDLKVLGYLLGDGENEEAPKVTVRETITEVKLIRERTIVGDSKPWESDDDSFRDF